MLCKTLCPKPDLKAQADHEAHSQKMVLLTLARSFRHAGSVFMMLELPQALTFWFFSAPVLPGRGISLLELFKCFASSRSRSTRRLSVRVDGRIYIFIMASFYLPHSARHDAASVV